MTETQTQSHPASSHKFNPEEGRAAFDPKIAYPTPRPPFLFGTARAPLLGETDDWILDPLTPADAALLSSRYTLVATYVNGEVTIYGDKLGHSARDYLGADLAWARDAATRAE